LVHDFGLVVDTLDADETLFKGMSLNNIQFKVFQKLSACLYFRLRKSELFMCREDCEKGHQGKWVIEVSEGVEKVWVPLSDQMIQ
jgi:hypothetical protein